jgi:predicted Zn-dependent protease
LDDDNLTVKAEFERACALRDAGKLEEAAEIFLRKAPATGKHEASCLMMAGALLVQLKQFKRAVTALRRSTTLRPDHELASMSLVHALAGAELDDDALEEMKRFIIDNGALKGDYLLLYEEIMDQLNRTS